VRPDAASRREYGLALLAGAGGAGLILLAVRQRWAEAVFTPPKPLTPQVVPVSGADLVPLAGALAVAALAGLAAVIATRGVLRRAAGVLLAAFGAGAGAAVTATVSAASVLSVAASRVGSPGSAAISGAAGSTTSGSSGGAPIVVAGSSGHLQIVKSVALDCDGDAILVRVDQVGVACHTGDRTCFDADMLQAAAGERPDAVPAGGEKSQGG